MAMLLMVALFVPVACTDYDEDIKNVQGAVEDIISGEIDPAGVDVKGLAEDLTEVSGKLDELIADHEADVADLDAALKAGDKALGEEIAAVAADLTVAEGLIDALETEVEALKAADEALKTADETNAAAIAAEVVAREQAVKDLTDTLSEMVEEVSAEFDEAYERIELVNEAIDGLESVDEELKASIADNAAKIAAAEENIASLISFAQGATQAIQNHEAAIASLTEELNGLNEQYKNHLIDYQQFVQQVNYAVTNHEAAISKLTEDLAGLTSRVASLEGTVQSLTEFASQVTYTVQNLQVAVETLSAYQEDLKETIIPGLEEQIGKNAQDIEDLRVMATERLDLLEKSFTMLNNLVQDNYAEFLEYQDAVEKGLTEKFGEIGEQIIALDIENVRQNRVLEDQAILIEAVQEQVALNAEAILDVRADLAQEAAYRAELQLAFEEFSQLVNNTLLQHGMDIQKLQGDVEDLRSDYDAHIKEYQQFYADVVNAIQNHQTAIEANKEEIDALKEKFAAHELSYQEFYQQVNFALANLTSTLNGAVEDIAALSNDVDTIYGQLSALDGVVAGLLMDVETLQGDLEALQEQAADLDERLSTLEGDFQALLIGLEQTVDGLQVQIDVIADDVQALKDAFSQHNATVEQWAASVNGKIEDIYSKLDDVNDRFEGVEGDIEELMNRVQSIVYVPDHVDGKATAEWVILDNTILGATTTMTYQVYPEEAAAAIAYAIAAAEADAEVVSPLSFQLECLKTTRALHDETAEILEVGAIEGGRLVVKAALKGLADDFFYAGPKQAEEGYALSLVLDKEDGSNLSTCFTQLAPTSEPVEADVKIYRDGKDVTNKNVGTISVAYTEAGYVWNPVKNHYFVFEVGEAKYTADELAAAGYDVPKYKCTQSIFTNPGSAFADWLSLYSGGSYVAMVAEVDAAGAIYGQMTLPTDNARLQKMIGTAGTVTYKYSNGLTVAETLEITKETAKLDLGVAQITWCYDNDAAIDADLLEGTTSFYSRDAVSLNPVMAGDELPADTTIADVLSGELKSVLINGVVNEDIMIGFNAEEATAYMAISGFDWGEEYEIKALFELKNVLVEAYLNLTTVDRSRDVIEVLHTTEVVLYNNIGWTCFEEASPVANISMDEVYNQITYDLGTYNTPAKWITDNFGRAWTVDANTVAAYESLVEGNEDVEPVVKNIEVTWTTNHEIEATDAGVEASTGYSYKSFDFIPEALRYTKEITLWYGQEVRLVQDVVFVLPAVYDFKHSPIYVYGSDAEGYYSEVQPYYLPDLPTTALEVFDVKTVNMNTAFNVKNSDGEVLILDTENGTTTDEVNNLNFVAEFELEPTYGEGIAINNNAISYYDEDEYVDVYGALYVEFDNGARMKVATNFDGGIYDNYIVKKFDPILKPVANYTYPVEVDNAREYTVSIFDIVELQDVREYDLVDGRGFVVGDDENGFAMGVNTAELYGLGVEWADNISNLDVEIRKYFSFENGVLTFDNSGQVELTKPVPVKVNMNVYSAWGTYPMEVVVTFAPKVVALE